jgi:hypothetical protein
MDLDPYPAIIVYDLQDSNTIFFLIFFCLLLLELEQLRHGGPYDVLLRPKGSFLRIRDIFGYGSGSAEKYLPPTNGSDPDLALNPVIFVTNLQGSKQKTFFSLFSYRIHKTVGIRVFVTNYA